MDGNVCCSCSAATAPERSSALLLFFRMLKRRCWSAVSSLQPARNLRPTTSHPGLHSHFGIHACRGGHSYVDNENPSSHQDGPCLGIHSADGCSRSGWHPAMG